MNWTDWGDTQKRLSQFACNNPVLFVGLTSFAALGVIPAGAFAVYTVATLVASLVGALILEAVLLAVGIAGLAIVLLFVICISGCVMSVFSALYYSYLLASRTVKKVRRPWPISRPSDSSQTQTDEPVDKTK